MHAGGMRSSLSLGRVHGIRIGLHWSLVFIAAFLWWSLGAQLLPSAVPGSSPALDWLTAGLMVVAFYGSLLGHELCHAGVAQHRGIRVRGITLWLIGGVAEMEGDSRSAGEELKIAAAGPAGSLALAVVFWALAELLSRAGASAVAVTAATWLAEANGVLAVFNLVPAFPLDGGRILRALLWKVRGRRQWATAVAARTGQVLGVAMAGVGLVTWLRGSSALGGPWLLIVGGFIISAARAQLQVVRDEAVFDGLRAADIMTPQPFTAPAGASVQSLVDRWVRTCPFSSLPLVDQSGQLVGLVTAPRLQQVPAAWWPVTPATAVSWQAADVVVCQPGDDLAEVVRRLQGARSLRAVVVDGYRPVGIITPTDLNRVAAAHRGIPPAAVRSVPQRSGSAV